MYSKISSLCQLDSAYIVSSRGNSWLGRTCCRLTWGYAAVYVGLHSSLVIFSFNFQLDMGSGGLDLVELNLVEKHMEKGQDGCSWICSVQIWSQ